MDGMEELRRRVLARLPAESRDHAQATAALCRQLAERHGGDADQAELAGLAHDIAEGMTPRQMRGYLRRQGLQAESPVLRAVPDLLHAPVGALILERELGLADPAILKAVASHIVGGEKMGLLDKILFVADKLEPGRQRHYAEALAELRELAFSSLDEAYMRLSGWRVTRLLWGGAGSRAGDALRLEVARWSTPL